MINLFNKLVQPLNESEYWKNEEEYNSEQRFKRNFGVAVRFSGDLLLFSTYARGFTNFESSIGTRAEIKSFSQSSAKRMRKYLRECTTDYTAMFTLTYPHGHGFEGGRCKQDLRNLLKRIKRTNYWTNESSVFWFMEFQSRGSIHFHCFSNFWIDKEWLARSWYEICGTDDERHRHAGTRVERLQCGRAGLQSYAAKYAAKSEQKVIPDHFGWVGRFWGVTGVNFTVSANTRIMAEDYGFKAKEAINKANDIINAGIECGLIKVLFENQDVYGISIKSHGIRKQLKLIFLKLDDSCENLSYRRFLACGLDGADIT